jgi:hypothetical protein
VRLALLTVAASAVLAVVLVAVDVLDVGQAVGFVALMAVTEAFIVIMQRRRRQP